MSWLDPVRRALDAQPGAHFFFRDDDVGSATGACASLLDLFESAAKPIDLAVIPCALSVREAAALRARRARGERVGWHPHGFAHANRERVGRKCEFGAWRGSDEVRAELAHGRELLLDLLGEVDPIFTPPWNRCGESTCRALAELGFVALSRDAGAAPVDAHGLTELPVRIDFTSPKTGTRAGPGALGRRLAGEVEAGGVVGVMLHHAVMNSDDLERLAELLEMIDARRVRVSAMRDLVAALLVQESAR